MFISVSLFDDLLVIEYIQHICFHTTRKLPFCGYNMYVANIQDAGAFREATADDVVATAIRKLGRQPSIVHGWTNKILTFSVRILPRRMVMAITGAALKGRTSH